MYRYLLLFLFSILVSNNSSYSQTCLSEGIFFLNQTEIDAFPSDYPGCTVIEGYVRIRYTDIENLDSLRSLTRVDGKLEIFYNNSLLNIEGLQNLTSVGELVISSNDILPDLTGLENLDSTDFDLRISGNEQLRNINALQNLNYVGEMLQIHVNERLKNIDSLQNLTYVGGDLQISANDSLLNIEGLKNLEHAEKLSFSDLPLLTNIDSLNNLQYLNELSIRNLDKLHKIEFLELNDSLLGGVQLTNCPIVETNYFPTLSYIGEDFIVSDFELSNFEGFENLSAIKGNFSVKNNDSLINFAGLESLVSIGGDLYIGEETINDNGNLLLSSLNGLNSLDSVIGNVKIQGNDTLSRLVAFENLSFIGGDLKIEGNNLDSLDLGSLNYLGGDLFLESQNMYSSVTISSSIDSIHGSLTLKGGLYDLNAFNALNYVESINLKQDSIQDLTGLNNINSIGGDLFISYSKNLSSFNGLDNLSHIEGSLSLFHLEGLSSVAGMNNLSTIGGSFYFSYISSLTNLIGLENLENIQGHFLISNCTVKNTLGLSNLNYIGGNFDINHNDSLESLDGFDLLQTIGGYINFDSNDTLYSIQGLDNLTTIGSHFKVKNSKFSSPTGFSLLDSIGGSILIEENPYLKTLPNFQNLTSIGGRIEITENDSLLHLDPLTSLVSMEGDLLIDNNYNLIHLNGLSNLVDFGGDEIDIHHNDQLNSIDGINGIDISDLTTFQVWLNPNLADCNILSLCEALTIPSIYVLILDNKTGCESVSTVEQTCLEIDCAPDGVELLSQEDIDNFPLSYNSCTVIEGDLIISGSDITNLDSLYAITALRSSLIIGGTNSSNPLLTDISGLGNLNYIEGDLVIVNNDSLESLIVFSSLDTISGDLTVTNNPLLSECDIEALCFYLNNGSGVITISDNAIGCNSEEELELTCVTGPCLPEGIIFSNQYAIDHFKENYPNCSIIQGNVRIGLASNLDSLAVLTAIEGDLWIGQPYPSVMNPELIDLSGLENLTSIEGDFGIWNNEGLENLNGLESLVFIGGDFMIGGVIENEDIWGIEYVQHPNPELININDLSSLEHIGGKLLLYESEVTDLSGFSSLSAIDSSMYIVNNAELNSINGFESLMNANKDIRIESNEMLSEINGFSMLVNIKRDLVLKDNALSESIEGFQNLISIDRGFTIKEDSLLNFSNFTSLTDIYGDINIKAAELLSFDGLNNIDSVGMLSITYCPKILDFSGFENLKSIDGKFEVHGNDTLFNFMGLNNLKSISGELDVGESNARNENLRSLEGLENLESIGSLSISFQDSIKNLDPLENLVLIDGNGFYITRNESLTNLDGLQNVVAPNLGTIIISDNDELAHCTAQFLCDNMAESGVNVVINGNKNSSGCYNQESVEILCTEFTCLPNGITLSSQYEVDAFSYNYDYCHFITGDLIVEGDDIVNLNGLQQIEYVRGEVKIINNPSLINVSGLSFIYPDSITQLTITNNPSLQYCNIPSFCGYVANSGNSVTIANNGTDCNTESEITDACLNNYCGGGTFVLNTQTQVDNYASYWPYCEGVSKGLEIMTTLSTDSIIDLSPLSFISEINGELNIRHNPYLQSLQGLNNVKKIEGDFNFTNNDQITDLEGLNSLDTINGKMIISQTALDNLSGLDSLIRIGGETRINAGLSTISNLRSLKSVGGILWIIGLESNDLTGLDSLNEVWGDLRLEYNNFESLNGLNNLESIIGDLYINENNYLVDISALSNLRNLHNNVDIRFNDLLPNLIGLDSLTPEYIDQLNIFNNANLSYCSAAALCEYLDLSGSNVNISGNAPGCSSEEEVNDFCETGPCFPDGLTLSTQNSIDSFPITNPFCSQMFGNLIISGSSITNLDSLSIITSILGDLTISDNPSLATLDGLSNLTSIDGNLTIDNNDSLLSISGLSSLNASSIIDLTISNNPALAVCEAQSICDYLVAPNGLVIIENNGIYCNSITEVEEFCEGLSPNLFFSSQSEVDDFLNGCIDCENITGNVIIIGADITNLDGLSGIVSISGDLIIGDTIGNPLLTNLSGLSSLTSIGGSLSVQNNASLENFAGVVSSMNAMELSSLTEIGGDLKIAHNQSLQNLLGLEDLESIGGDLIIEDNISMTSLMGISSLDYQSIQNLYIFDNPELSTCQVQTVCSYIGDPTGVTEIYNNNEDCNSPDEVYAICSVGLEELDVLPFVIYPNPADDVLYITSGEMIRSDRIYNQQGQEVLYVTSSSIIDLKSLPKGLYIVEIKYDLGVFTDRVLVQ